MTYRMMAEWTTDLVAKKLGNTAPCITHEKPLPGSENAEPKKPATASLAKPVYQSAIYRHGERAEKFLSNDKKSQAVICECEMVTCGEVEYAIKDLDVHNLVDLRRRTRIGMGLVRVNFAPTVPLVCSPNMEKHRAIRRAIY